MLKHRATRFTAVLVALAFLAPATASAKDETVKGSPIRVAIMPIMNSSAELSATKIMEDIIRERMKVVQTDRVHFLQPTDTERILASRNLADRADRLNDRWSKYGTIDTTAVEGLDSLLQSDAILFVKVVEWENLRVNVVGRGESNTTIALHFALYDLKTLREIWSKEPREQRFAQEVDPSSGSVTYDETGYIQSRGVTDPPRYEDVASDLIRSAFKKFPDK
ncbi:MAG: hypothetical protein ACRENN_09125 [Candidatus Eiseniibacteriota bacterium]